MRKTDAIVLLVVLALTALLIPLARGRAPQATPSPEAVADAWERHAGCTSNLKIVSTALELWSNDHTGRFPPSLTSMCPNYLKQIPTCPAAQRDTCSSGYRSDCNPDAYTIYCAGKNHLDIGEPVNNPQFTSVVGLRTGVPVSPTSAAQLRQCTENLGRIGGAAESYRREHKQYPRVLWTLVPRYLNRIPTCPAARADTYSWSSTADDYTALCRGHHHADAGQPPDSPLFRPGSIR